MTRKALITAGKKLATAVVKRKPEILTGLGIAGFCSAIYMAATITPKAMALIDEKKKEKNVEKLGFLDTAKTIWMCYLPTTLTAVISASCLIGANSESARRNAALATAYTLSETAAKDYQEKVIESIGEKKEQGIRDAIAKDSVEKTPMVSREVIITEKGNTLCFDMISKRYFCSDIEALRKIVNDLNLRMRSEYYVSLNDFYYEINLEPLSIGDDIGWNIDRGYVELSFSSQIANDGRPCLVIDYKVTPKYGYRD